MGVVDRVVASSLNVGLRMLKDVEGERLILCRSMLSECALT
jgi:hypothetical protein